METKVAFKTLDIDKTKNEKEIREAYMNMLSVTNPEDDPEGFKRLREAYEVALAYTREEEQEKEYVPVTDVDFFLEDVKAVYNNINTRFDIDEWKRLLDDPICEGLDTSLEIRERILVFLMDNYQISHEVWALLDKVFEFTVDKEALQQQFPEDFLGYMFRHIEERDVFPYALLKYTEEDLLGEEPEPDTYLNSMFEIKQRIDSMEYVSENITEEQLSERTASLEKCLNELKDLDVYGVYHPHTDVEIMRIAVLTDDMKLAEELCNKIIDYVDRSVYLAIYVGEVLNKLGDKEQAFKIWSDVVEIWPDYYRARYNRVVYYMEKEMYYEARKEMEELFQINENDDRIYEMLKTANAAMIEEFKEKLEKGEDHEHYKGYELKLEYAWCLFQNERDQEAIEFMKSNPPAEAEDEFGFNNILGRTLYKNKKYEEALPYLLRWRELLWEMKEDGTDRTKRRIERKAMASGMISGVYYELGDMDKAIEYAEEAIDVAGVQDDLLQAMNQKSYYLFKNKEYEKCIDVCEKILKIDSNYYPAIVNHQKSAFEIYNAQMVVDDYHRAVDIYPYYFKPYHLAAKVFFFYDQYKDSMEVIERAEENGVELSADMKFFKAKNIRSVAENEEDREKAFEIIQELLAQKTERDQKPNDDEQNDGDNLEWDIEDDSEINYELALLYWDSNNLEKAAEYLNKAMDENQSRKQYKIVFADLCCEQENYKQALYYYDESKSAYEDNPSLYYGYANCYNALGKRDLEIENLEKVLTIRKVYSDTCERLSDLYMENYRITNDRAEFDKAIDCATRQVEENPHPYYYVHRGLIYMNAFDIDEAIADFKEALKLNDKDWAAWNNLGCCYKYTNKYEKGIECFEKALEIINSNNEKEVLPYSNMADCYEGLYNMEKAVECYKLDLELMDPNRLTYYEEIGRIQSDLGKSKEAIEAYKKCGGSELNWNIGDVYLNAGNYRKALHYYKKNVESNRKEDPSDLARAFRRLACAYSDFFYKSTKDIDKGIKFALEALECGDDPYERYESARIVAKLYFLKRDFDNAKSYAQEAVKHFSQMEQKSPEDYMSYKPFGPIRISAWAWIQLCLGNREKAFELFEQIDEQLVCRRCHRSQCYEKPCHLGDIYMALGEYEKAKEQYLESLRRDKYYTEAKIKLKKLEELLK